MVTINLLPWRAIAHAENSRKRKIFLMCVAILAMGWLVSHASLSWIAQTYDTRIENLQSQLTELADQKQQIHFNPAFSLTEKIYLRQLELINFFNVILHGVPAYVFWSEMTNKNNQIMMTGNADSILMLTRFVNTYNAKNKALSMVIQSAKKSDDISSVQFHLKLTRATLPFFNQIKSDDDV